MNKTSTGRVGVGLAVQAKGRYAIHYQKIEFGAILDISNKRVKEKRLEVRKGPERPRIEELALFVCEPCVLRVILYFCINITGGLCSCDFLSITKAWTSGVNLEYSSEGGGH